jgi:hypothetical protein
MLLIPAIDLKDGHCVRLKQGDMDQSTTFGEDPAAMARRWVDAGARRCIWWISMVLLRESPRTCGHQIHPERGGRRYSGAVGRRHPRSGHH